GRRNRRRRRPRNTSPDRRQGRAAPRARAARRAGRSRPARQPRPARGDDGGRRGGAAGGGGAGGNRPRGRADPGGGARQRPPDGGRGGDLGWFARGTMPKVFDEACFSLKPGQVSGVMQSSYGYHLFKLLGRRPAKKRSLDEVQKEVIRKAFLEKKAQAERQLLDQVN